MESSASSNDSFLWTNASNDSNDHQNISVKSNSAHCEETGASYKNDGGDSNTSLQNHREIPTQKHCKKSMKRKSSESTQEGSNFIQPERKRIKLEPDSDIEASKKKNKAGNEKTVYNNKSSESILKGGNYLNLKVKQEQISIVASEGIKPKKKKKRKSSPTDIDKDNNSEMDLRENEMEGYLDLKVKEEQASIIAPVEKHKRKKKHEKSHSLIGSGCEPESAGEPNRNDTEGYLNMRVKQEEASIIEQKVLKPKKKKKRRDSIVTNTDIICESRPVGKINDTTNSNHLSNDDEHTGVRYSVIEEKFSAEETVVEKPRKKKHKKNDVKNNCHVDNGAEAERFSKDVEENSYNNTSLPAIDFSCNNIISSTIINSSSVDIMDSQNKRPEDLISKKVCNTIKISDRIMFEDDDNLSNLEVHFNKSSGKVGTFLKANPQLKLCPCKARSDSSITEDDEIWILRWPHEIDIQKLNNTNLTLEGKCKIKINGQSYDGVQNNDVNRITVLRYQHRQAFVSNLPVKGCVDYRKRIPKAHIPGNNSMVNNQASFIPLPDTKCRHPLFGAHYKKAMKIPSAIVERLKGAKDMVPEAPSYTRKKKKHKKDKNKSIAIKLEGDSGPEYETAKKKRKRKHSQDDEVPPKKTKRIKLDPDSAEVWESEQAIEQNLFNF